MSISDLDYEQIIQKVYNAAAASLKTTTAGMLVNVDYDFVGASYPDTVTEVYAYKTGGSGGTTVATVTVVYTTSAKDVLTSITKT